MVKAQIRSCDGISKVTWICSTYIKDGPTEEPCRLFAQNEHEAWGAWFSQDEHQIAAIMIKCIRTSFLYIYIYIYIVLQI